MIIGGLWKDFESVESTTLSSGSSAAISIFAAAVSGTCNVEMSLSPCPNEPLTQFRRHQRRAMCAPHRQRDEVRGGGVDGLYGPGKVELPRTRDRARCARLHVVGFEVREGDEVVEGVGDFLDGCLPQHLHLRDIPCRRPKHRGLRPVLEERQCKRDAGRGGIAEHAEQHIDIGVGRRVPDLRVLQAAGEVQDGEGSRIVFISIGIEGAGVRLGVQERRVRLDEVRWQRGGRPWADEVEVREVTVAVDKRGENRGVRAGVVRGEHPERGKKQGGKDY
ncbi:hypothetical protein DFH09DRAFT_1079408 [Mycena vulgaris]|nr:hypothetical protein DFH09DRAFT_1079408 [Mycena vulgaris]